VTFLLNATASGSYSLPSLVKGAGKAVILACCLRAVMRVYAKKFFAHLLAFALTLVNAHFIKFTIKLFSFCCIEIAPHKCNTSH
jgi:hypothetical protein